MSTKLSDISGVYKKVINNNTAKLKFAYFSKLEYNKSTTDCLAQLRIYTIPNLANVLISKEYGSLICSDSNSSIITKTFDDNTSIDSALVFNTFDIPSQYPKAGFKSILQNNTILVSKLASTVNSLFISIIFKADLSDLTDISILMYEPTNSLLVPIKVTDSNIVDLGDNFHVLKVPNSFAVKVSAVNSDFKLPYFALTTYYDKYLPVETAFELHDIGIAVV